VLFLRKYTLKRVVVHAEDQRKVATNVDVEKGTALENASEREGESAAIAGVLEDDSSVRPATSSNESKFGSTKEDSWYKDVAILLEIGHAYPR